MTFGVAANPMREPARVASRAIAEHVRRKVAASERSGDRCRDIERSTTISGDCCDCIGFRANAMRNCGELLQTKRIAIRMNHRPDHHCCDGLTTV
jgi:hypothetical protein